MQSLSCGLPPLAMGRSHRERPVWKTLPRRRPHGTPDHDPVQSPRREQCSPAFPKCLAHKIVSKIRGRSKQLSSRVIRHTRWQLKGLLASLPALPSSPAGKVILQTSLSYTLPVPMTQQGTRFTLNATKSSPGPATDVCHLHPDPTPRSGAPSVGRVQAGVQLAWETLRAGTHRRGQGGINLASAAGRGSSSQSLLSWRHRVG